MLSEEQKKYNREWRLKNKEKIAEYRKGEIPFRIRYSKYRDDVLDHYGAVCKCCGEKTREFLCVDHVNNDGAEHRRTIGKKTSIYIWLRKNDFPDTVQILCFNCNNAKQYYKACPHQCGQDNGNVV